MGQFALFLSREDGEGQYIHLQRTCEEWNKLLVLTGNNGYSRLTLYLGRAGSVCITLYDSTICLVELISDGFYIQKYYKSRY